jgi:hypothetical protein
VCTWTVVPNLAIYTRSGSLRYNKRPDFLTRCSGQVGGRGGGGNFPNMQCQGWPGVGACELLHAHENLLSLLVFWAVTSSRLGDGYQRFGDKYRFHLQGWRHKQHVSPKRRYLSTSLHGVTIQKTFIDISTAMKTSNLKLWTPWYRVTLQKTTDPQLAKKLVVC